PSFARNRRPDLRLKDSGRKNRSSRHTLSMRNILSAGLLMVLVACSAGEAPPSAPAAVPKPAPAAKPAAAKRAVLFNTPEADAILSTLQIFPKDNPWNEDISDRPVAPDSEK